MRIDSEGTADSDSATAAACSGSVPSQQCAPHTLPTHARLLRGRCEWCPGAEQGGDKWGAACGRMCARVTHEVAMMTERTPFGMGPGMVMRGRGLPRFHRLVPLAA